jgi:hypothetical protein
MAGHRLETMAARPADERGEHPVLKVLASQSETAVGPALRRLGPRGARETRVALSRASSLAKGANQVWDGPGEGFVVCASIRETRQSVGPPLRLGSPESTIRQWTPRNRRFSPLR